MKVYMLAMSKLFNIKYSLIFESYLTNLMVLKSLYSELSILIFPLNPNIYQNIMFYNVPNM